MRSRAGWLVILMLCLGLAGCSGGGGDPSPGNPVTPPPAPVSSPATLRVGIAGVSVALSGLKATLTLPAGVTVVTNSDGSVPSGSVVPSGVLSPASAAVFPDSLSYDPAARTLSFILYSTVQGGFLAGEFAGISCQVTGAAPPPGAFSGVLEPVDLLGNALSRTGVSASFLVAP